MTMTIPENTAAPDFGAANAQKSLPPVAEAASGLERIWIWFADNGNIRKWQRKPFAEGTEYVVAAHAGAELDEMTRSCLAERAQRFLFEHGVDIELASEVVGLCRPTPPVAEAVEAEPVDYPRILYVCEHCQENAPEMCGRSRDDLYVTPSGQWLCDECRDEEGVPISDCVSPPVLYPASTVARLQQEIQRLTAAELSEVRQQYVDANEARIDAEAALAEARKALEPFAMVAEHDIGEDETDSDAFRPMPKPFNHAPRITVGHLRAARRALTGGQEDG